MQVHDATEDPAALRLAMAMADDTSRFFAGPNHGGVGLLYATPKQDPSHQGVSTMFEALLARTSLDIHRVTGIQGYLDHARASWAWMHHCLRHPAGVYFCELDIRPTVGGAPNPHLRIPIGGDRPGDIKRGGSVAYLGGAMAPLSAALWLQDGAPGYRAEVDSIIAGMLQPAIFLRPGDLFVNDRDAWSDGNYAPAFVADVLSLDGADPTGTWRRALAATALSIIRQRTPDGFYGPDWSGSDWSGSDWSGSDWSGPDWSGPDWSGPDWSGPEWDPRPNASRPGRPRAPPRAARTTAAPAWPRPTRCKPTPAAWRWRWRRRWRRAAQGGDRPLDAAGQAQQD